MFGPRVLLLVLGLSGCILDKVNDDDDDDDFGGCPEGTVEEEGRCVDEGETVTVHDDDSGSTDPDSGSTDPDSVENRIQITPDPLDMGDVALYDFTVEGVRVDNLYDHSVIISAAVIDHSDMSAYPGAGDLPLEVDAHESTEILVAFSPRHAASYEATLSIGIAGVGNVQSQVTGRGISATDTGNWGDDTSHSSGDDTGYVVHSCDELVYVLTANLGDDLGAPVWEGNTEDEENNWNSGCGSSTARDAIFRWNPPWSGNFIITTNGSSFDTVLEVMNVDCEDTECNDDSGDGTRSRITGYFSRSEDYYIILDGYSRSDGPYELNIAEEDDGDGDDTGYAGSDSMPAIDVIVPGADWLPGWAMSLWTPLYLVGHTLFVS